MKHGTCLRPSNTNPKLGKQITKSPYIARVLNVCQNDCIQHLKHNTKDGGQKLELPIWQCFLRNIGNVSPGVIILLSARIPWWLSMWYRISWQRNLTILAVRRWHTYTLHVYMIFFVFCHAPFLLIYIYNNYYFIIYIIATYIEYLSYTFISITLYIHLRT